MWLFENLATPAVRFHLLVGEDYQVGRKDCRIIISKDQSVSRKHAVIRVSHPEGNLGKPSMPATVSLQDSSKFGTVVNGSKIDLGSTVTLKDGDQVTFGAMNTNQWKLTFNPLVVAFSSIPSSEKKILKPLVLKLGGHVVSEWSKECTHLIMAQLSVTIKVTAALITCRPIVTPQYLHSLKEAAQNDNDVPDTTNFRPTVIEEAVDTKEVTFDPNHVRSALFKDKTFIFVAQKQFKQLGHTIELGGGKVILMEEGDKQTFSALTKASSIVMYADPEDSMQAPTQDTQDWIREVMQHLKRHGLRPIPVSELGLAVLYASTQLHCNPKVAQAGLNLLNAAPSQTTHQPQVLVSDTEASISAKTSASVVSSHDRSHRLTAARQQKVPETSSLEEERKVAQQTKKRSRQGSAQETASKVAKLEPPSPAPEERHKSRNVEVAETPQKSSESLPSASGIKTSPEFSFVGNPPPSKTSHFTKQEVVSPPAEKNNNKQTKVANEPLGQRSSEVVMEEEEKMEMESDQEDESSVNVKNQSGASGSRDEKLHSKQKKKSRTATLDSIWDLEVGGGGRRQKKQKQVKEEVVVEEEQEEDEEEEGGDQVDVKATDDASAEDSQNTMWKKKRKRNVLDEIEEDEARESQLSQQQDDTESKDFKRALSDVRGGFVSAAKPPKEEQATTKFEPKGEPEGDDQDAADPPPYAVVSITEERLVIRKPKPRPTNTSAVIGRTNVKNFKKFRKAAYAGQTGMPQIIGGRDLEEHCNKPNDEVDDMMFGGYQAEQRRTKEDELAEKLFADEPRGRKGRRR